MRLYTYGVYIAPSDKKPTWSFQRWASVRKLLDRLAYSNGVLRVFIHYRLPDTWQVVEFHKDQYLWETKKIERKEWSQIAGEPLLRDANGNQVFKVKAQGHMGQYGWVDRPAASEQAERLEHNRQLLEELKGEQK